ncbi:unnamed protein product [Cyprideis torosa]|uniref:Uncharacterized protein n=1 Tax=Cyprideis torosa TaxID=163714 RepID=A0A7R8ZL77_9CRUS|nr:unnamed protein product [Cyprideis torosa]CAG0892810.1 unnamed protein product [Cyprideis torosa]
MSSLLLRRQRVAAVGWQALRSRGLQTVPAERKLKPADRFQPKDHKLGERFDDQVWKYRGQNMKFDHQWSINFYYVMYTLVWTWIFYHEFYHWRHMHQVYDVPEIERMSDSFLGIPESDEDVIRAAPEKWRRKWGYNADAEIVE